MSPPTNIADYRRRDSVEDWIVERGCWWTCERCLVPVIEVHFEGTFGAFIDLIGAAMAAHDRCKPPPSDERLHVTHVSRLGGRWVIWCRCRWSTEAFSSVGAARFERAHLESVPVDELEGAPDG